MFIDSESSLIIRSEVTIRVEVINVDVCAQSNVFCSEPPKGGGVSSERNESCMSEFDDFGRKSGLLAPYCDVILS